jgi:tRNA(fMet)-specific endonuclease VapC
MNPTYLVDTDWVIHYLNGNKEIVAMLSSLGSGQLAMSVISLAELYEGVYYSTNPEKNEKVLSDFLSGILILGIEDDICKVFGRERGKLRKQGAMIGDFDLVIASTCLRHGLTLLSNNRSHFERIAGLSIESS